jgi:hypothetical protein
LAKKLAQAMRKPVLGKSSANGGVWGNVLDAGLDPQRMRFFHSNRNRETCQPSEIICGWQTLFAHAAKVAATLVSGFASKRGRPFPSH